MPISYTVREGLSGFKRARFAAFASTSAMAVALVLIGLFVLTSYHTNQVSQWLKQRVGEVEIFLKEVDDHVATAVNDRARSVAGVAETQYISRNEAALIFQQEFGDGAEIFMGDAFLPASIRVRVQPGYANPDSLNRLVSYFAEWNQVDDVVFNQPLLIKVQQNLRLVSAVGLALGILVVLASLFLVANTIRLTIYARRLLIRTMKLVGATDSFIRRPFIIEGVAQGLLAGIAAGIGLWGLFELLVRLVPQLQEQGWPGGTPLLTVLAVVSTGVLLGWLGSLLAVRRFIHSVKLH